MSKEKKVSLRSVGFIWLSVGIGLSIAGLNWLMTLPMGPKLVIFCLLALSVGIAKGIFVLSKVAKKYSNRADVINFKKGDLFIGWAKIFGIKGAFLIGIMMTMGSFLRHSSIDRPILGILYYAVGLALLTSSMVFFQESEAI